MGDLEHALSAYENALRHNALSVSGLTQVAGIARIKENYSKVNIYPPHRTSRSHDVTSSHFRPLIISNVFSISKKTTERYGVLWVCLNIYIFKNNQFKWLSRSLLSDAR